MSMRKKILIFGHYGVPNWGDEAILSGMLQTIDFTKFSVTVVTDNKKFTKHHHHIKSIYPPAFGIRSFFRGGFFTFLSVLNNTDYVIFGGGGLFQDRPKQALSLWIYYLNFCLWKRKKIFLLGNSFEELQDAEKNSVLEKKFSSVKFFSVRDKESKKILQKKFSIPSLKISETSDAAYFLESKAKPGRKKGILLAFREGEMTIEKEKKIINILKKKFSKEFETKNVEVLIMQEKNAGDNAFAERHNLKKFFPDSLSHLQEKIRSSRLVVTTRLHAGILANLSGTAFIAISPREKISQFFGEKFSIPLATIFTKQGEKQFCSMIQNIQKTKPAQKNFMLEQKKKLKNFFPDFMTL